MNKITVLFFTGSRADYGLLRPLINRFSKDKSLTTKMVASVEVYCKHLGSLPPTE